MAVMQDDTGTMQRLLKQGVNINAADKQGKTPLFFAIAYQRNKAVQFLLTHGANVNFKDTEGKTALHWAVAVSSALMDILVKLDR